MVLYILILPIWPIFRWASVAAVGYVLDGNFIVALKDTEYWQSLQIYRREVIALENVHVLGGMVKWCYIGGRLGTVESYIRTPIEVRLSV
jgi:hypothetical protein